MQLRLTKQPCARAGLALILVALLCACATADGPKPVVPQSVIQAPGKATVTVVERDAGARVVVDMSQELRIDLPNSSWAIANNLEWSVEASKPGVLTVLGSRFERAPRYENPSESGGTTSWRIKPQGPGQTKLTFVLRRPRSLLAPVQTAAFEVQVK